MRNIEGLGVYDGAFCFGNSFGFLEYADMEKFLAGVARALKPGARFIVNTAMAAESVLPDFEEQSCHEMGDIVMTIKERYLAEESCVDSEYIFERNGEIRLTQSEALDLHGCGNSQDAGACGIRGFELLRFAEG